MRLKICDSHLICKVANKCLNVSERVEVVEWNKRWSPPLPCCPVSCQCPWKKSLIEKKFFLKSSRCFGPLGKFQHNIKISIKTACVCRLSFLVTMLPCKFSFQCVTFYQKKILDPYISTAPKRHNFQYNYGWNTKANSGKLSAFCLNSTFIWNINKFKNFSIHF